MKHIFKKLHIGSNHEPARSNEGPIVSTSSLCASDHRTASTQQSGDSPASPSTSSPSPISTVGSTSTTNVSSSTFNRPDYMLSEEEFQFQLALAISASSNSNSEFCDDPDKDQIRAATMMSLGTHQMDTARDKNEAAAEALSRRYWDNQTKTMIGTGRERRCLYYLETGIGIGTGPGNPSCGFQVGRRSDKTRIML